MSIRAILFDLDGTLLPIDTDQFIHSYMKILSSYVSHLVDPQVFIKELWASTMKMIQSEEDHLTNREVFDSDFFPKMERAKEMIPLVDRFYEEEFPKLGELVNSHAFIPQLIEAAKNKGYRLVVATNPLFPKSAIYQRILWAGARPEDFEHITTYENCHYTKPNPKYYQEIVQVLGLDPRECLMVGNDVQEDMIAQSIGMKTYLVTDKVIDRGEPRFIPDGRGTMEEFFQELLEEKGIFSVKTRNLG